VSGDDDSKFLPEGRRVFGSFIKGADKKSQKRKRKRSIRQEDRIAEEIGGRRVPGSGNKASGMQVGGGAHGTRGSSGDVNSRDFKVEAKYTDKKSYRIDEKTVLKAFFEAETEGKDWLLQVDIHGFDSVGPSRFAILDWDVFVELLSRARGDDESS